MGQGIALAGNVAALITTTKPITAADKIDLLSELPMLVGRLDIRGSDVVVKGVALFTWEDDAGTYNIAYGRGDTPKSLINY